MTATPLPRRTCPACQRRYAGLVDPECVVCLGVGNVTLGPAVLHYYPPTVAARAIELYLEKVSAVAAHTAPTKHRRQLLESAVDDLRRAGAIATTATGTVTVLPDPPTRELDLEAEAATVSLGATPDPMTARRLDAHPTTVGQARPRRTALPVLSAAGHPSHLAQLADPVDPLGPDMADLEREHRTTTATATAIVSAIPDVIRRKDRRHAR